MTIKEIEARSGMPRATIRFYEEEGLLAPARGENGYRDYSEEDLEELKRIQLLRLLHFSLEEIKRLHRGGVRLAQVLTEHGQKLRHAQEDVAQAQRVCAQLQEDGAEYQTLETWKYLDDLGRLKGAEAELPDVRQEPPTASVIEAEENPFLRISREAEAERMKQGVQTCPAPWRRFLAREFDFQLWYLLVQWVFVFVLKMNIHPPAIRMFLVLPQIALVFFAEPALLAVFGTTPGKWLLGLSVQKRGGGTLSYRDGVVRSLRLFFSGLGANLPLYGWWRVWKSYRACRDEEILEWDRAADSCVVLREEKGLKIACWLLLSVLLLSGSVWIQQESSVPGPVHRGRISAAEFCDNYNRLMKEYGVSGRMLTVEGWAQQQRRPANQSGASGSSFLSPEMREDEEELPAVTFTETDGVLHKVVFEQTLCFSHEDGTRFLRERMAPDYRELMSLAALSFAGAARGSRAAERSEMLQAIEDALYQDFAFESGGVRMECTIEYSGYTWGRGLWADASGRYTVSDYLVAAEGEDPYYHFRFVLERNAQEP